ncbi:hypothetical protein MKW94_023537 [Papaver nudicaule]|uniref:U1-type domain-containing protein n=1 Tax=Papaver nudicaule TaxID=74823 RepID=A0AA42AXW6_PAPNU|nr:hypothetical protein [Papaver nudicaule]
MVWFQCEDCGENLKKPKLLNHFRCCSAYKLSCIDCGVTFSQESVQAHTQCISETEKYGPKGGVKPGSNTPANTKQKPDVDTNVGLSTRPPWYCSLCKTSATSQQTLLLHADGKKHRAKARGFHASQQPPKAAEESTPVVTDSTVEAPKEESLTKQETPSESVKVSKKKRKIDSSDNGVVDKSAETTEVVAEDKKRKVKKENGSAKESEDADEETADAKEASIKKIKWKKVITSILKEQEKTNFTLDKRILQKAVINTLIKTNCVPADIDARRRKELKDMVMQQVESSSKFKVDLNHLVKLTKKE